MMVCGNSTLRRALVWSIAGFGLSAGGCSEAAQVRATIVDKQGQPIPGAILYAESYTAAGPIDFVFASAGRQGEVPASSAAPLEIGWQRGAKIALAAFAPGKKPLVMYDPAGRIEADGIALTLEDMPEPGKRWEPRVAQLSLPFEESPKLAERLRKPEYADLRKAFLEAYKLLDDPKENPLPRETAKRQALEKLDTEATK